VKYYSTSSNRNASTYGFGVGLSNSVVYFGIYYYVSDGNYYELNVLPFFKSNTYMPIAVSSD